jgi:hypothetical protein
MSRNLVESVYGMSSIKIAHFVPIRLQTILFQIGWFLKIFFPENA